MRSDSSSKPTFAVEAAIQRAVIYQLRRRGLPDLVAFAARRGGFLSPKEAADQVSLGILADAPNIVIFCRRRVFALHIKSWDGRRTVRQADLQRRLAVCGVRVATAYGFFDAVSILEDWGVLWGRTSRRS